MIFVPARDLLLPPRRTPSELTIKLTRNIHVNNNRLNIIVLPSFKK
jgi:hypothetical protein